MQPTLDASGVPTWATFARSAKALGVSMEGEICLEPEERRGSGFYPLPSVEARISAACTPEDLGAAVLPLWSAVASVPFLRPHGRWRCAPAVDRYLLKKALRKALKPLLGSPHEANGELRYWLPLSTITVETVIWITPGGLAQWQYWHRLLPGRVDKMNQVRLGEELLLRCSTTDLLGVHVTQWDCMTDADIPSQVDLLAEAVRRFVEAAPSILDAAMHHDEYP